MQSVDAHEEGDHIQLTSKRNGFEEELLRLQSDYKQLSEKIPSPLYIFTSLALYGLFAFSLPFFIFQVQPSPTKMSSYKSTILHQLNSTNSVYEKLNQEISILQKTVSDPICECPLVSKPQCEPCPQCGSHTCPEVECPDFSLPETECKPCPECESQSCAEVECPDCDPTVFATVPTHRESVVRIISTNPDHKILQLMSSQFHDVALSDPVNFNDIPVAARPQSYMEMVKSLGAKKPDAIIGITKAHILAQLNVIDAASEYGIIFEDDAQLNPNLQPEEIIQQMKTAINNLKKFDSDWGVLLFGWCRWGDAPRQKVADSLFRVPPETNTDTGCMHAYAISIEAAKKHITYHNMARVSDAFLNILHHAKTFSMYIYDPVLFVQPWQLEKKQQWYPKWFGGPIGPDYGDADMRPNDL